MDPERYEVADVIGSGGMATVWRARDNRLGRVVAIKRPHPAPAGSTVLERFAREARAAARVDHPNLVSVFDVGEDDAGPYLVMEFVDGPSLASATVPAGEVAAIGAQVAAALAALHEAGIVHGDVKPANILMARGGVKLTDFGIARADDDATLTQEGMVYATPQYAAPETLAGHERSAAADVYALGAVLHELVTASRWNPTAGSTQVMPPAPWPAVFDAALAPDPARRPSASALRSQLAALGTDPASAVTVAMVQTLPPPDPAPAPEPVAVSPVEPAPAAPVPVGPSSVTRSSTPAPAVRRDRHNARTATAIFAGCVVALVAVVALASLGGDGRGDTVFPAGLPSTPATDAATSPGSSVPTETTPPATDAPTTVAPTTEPPPTDPPTTATSATTQPARMIADELVALLDAEVAAGMDAKEADRIVERIDKAIAAADAGDTEAVEKALRDVFERIERHVGDDTREAAVDRVLALAVELGVDPDRIADAKGPGKNQDKNGD